MTFFIHKSCREIGSTDQSDISKSIEEYRDTDAFVLLGDPGCGKTELFKREAEATGGQYVTARNFLTLNAENSDGSQTIFIDGLDETRVGEKDFRSPLDRVRAKLQELGKPRFRLSCRDTDWLGENDSEALAHVSPSGKPRTLQLEPFTEQQIIEFLDQYLGEVDSKRFVQTAKTHGLETLLDNPQTLGLLADTLQGDRWPTSRSETFEFACQNLAIESNTEHRAANRNTTHNSESLLDAAGYLCCMVLLADRPYITFNIDDSDSVCLQKLPTICAELPFQEAIRTRLFKCTHEDRFSYSHRSVAEFLAARFIGKGVKEGNILLLRIQSLMTAGRDAGVVSGLRGLHAWMTVCCSSDRKELICRDPLGIILYGDVRSFSTSDKLFVLSELGHLAEQYPAFRWQDWSSSPFGALNSEDMLPTFKATLESTSRDNAHQAITDCVLDALQYGEPMPGLAQNLLSIVRDSTWWASNRRSALEAYKKIPNASIESVMNIANNILNDVIKDEDDELTGAILDWLYPNHITAQTVIRYLHPGKNEGFLGTYKMFWMCTLLKKSKENDVSIILNELAKNGIDWEGHKYNFIKKLVGELIARGLEESGDQIPDKQLVRWLSVGLDRYGHSMLETEYGDRVKTWFANRPKRYKGVLANLIPMCKTSNIRSEFYKCTAHLYGAKPPSDIGMWYLEKCDTCSDVELSKQLVEESVGCLIRKQGSDGLSLDLLNNWVQSRPLLSPVLEASLQCEIPDWQLEQVRNHHYRETKKKAINRNLRKQLTEIRSGTANVQTLDFLAKGYFGRYYECKGDTHYEKLSSLLGDDDELVWSALEGFRNCLFRESLPTVEEIAQTQIDNKVHLICAPCLAGAIEIAKVDAKNILSLDDSVLERLISFSYVYYLGKTPEWFQYLQKHHPNLVASTLVSHASMLLRKRVQHVSLLYDADAAEIARQSAIPLLRVFPATARKNQAILLDYLLKAAVQHADKKEFLKLVARKLRLTSMSIWQQVYWIASGVIVAPADYRARLSEFVRGKKSRILWLSGFISKVRETGLHAGFSDDTVFELIKLLTPFCTPDRPKVFHFVTPAMDMAGFVQSLISRLGGSTSVDTSVVLNKLLLDESLEHWHGKLRRAIHTHRVSLREASYQHPTLQEVQNTMANSDPANVADLAALTLDLLKTLSEHIRNSSTDVYKQFWNTDRNGKPTDPKVEDLCRDTLLNMLQNKIGSFEVDAQKEGVYANESRADIRVSFGGFEGFNVPIEIKRDKHPDIWTALRDQLISKYTRDPGAEGYGIYLVFWFGGDGLVRQPGTSEKPASALELQNALQKTLSAEESRRVKVIVIDVAKPQRT